VSQYQKGKTNLDFTEATDSEWQWHQLGHMQVCTSPQTGNHASTSPLKFFTDWMPFLLPNQQRQSTEGKKEKSKININFTSILPSQLHNRKWHLLVMLQEEASGTSANRWQKTTSRVKRM